MVKITRCPRGTREPSAEPVSTYESRNQALFSGDQPDVPGAPPPHPGVGVAHSCHTARRRTVITATGLVRHPRTRTGQNPARLRGSYHDRPPIFWARDRSRGSPQASNHGGEFPRLAVSRSIHTTKGVPHQGAAPFCFLGGGFNAQTVRCPRQAIAGTGHPGTALGARFLGPMPSRSARTS